MNEIFQDAFDQASKHSPKILFIVVAGNDELDIEKSFDVPANLRSQCALHRRQEQRWRKKDQQLWKADRHLHSW